jgi:rare lipoprotein A
VLLFALHCTSPKASVTALNPAGVPPDARPADPAEETPRVYTERGQASWYGGDGDGFAGGVTASGEIYDPSALTCAHRTLPFGTVIEVENLGTGKRTLLRVNDRGPFMRGRILDVSQRGAQELGMLKHGTGSIRLHTVDSLGRPAPVDPAVLQGNPYTIQVAALSNPANIDRITQALQAAYGPVTYQVVQGPGGATVKRIRVGTYPRLEMAQRASEQLAKFCKDRGLESFIIRQN